MNSVIRQVLFWSPRILCILFAILLGLFASDVFSEGYGFLETIVALFMHLIPAFIVVIVLAMAWRWEWVGAILFTAMGLFYLVWSWGELHWGAYLLISGPLVLAGILFMLNWIFKPQTRSG